MIADASSNDFARSLKSFFEQADGQTPSHGACLDFLANASGFESYEAMREAQGSPKATAPETVLRKRTMLDLDHDCDLFGPAVENDPRLRRYSIEIEQTGNSTRIDVLPEGETVKGYDAKRPALSVRFEVSSGAPMVTLSNNLKEDVLWVNSTPEGMLVCLEQNGCKFRPVDVGSEDWKGRYIGPEVLVPQHLHDTELGRVMAEQCLHAKSQWIDADAREFLA